jgi:hypothetical protein
VKRQLPLGSLAEAAAAVGPGAAGGWWAVEAAAAATDVPETGAEDAQQQALQVEEVCSVWLLVCQLGCSTMVVHCCSLPLLRVMTRCECFFMHSAFANALYC